MKKPPDLNKLDPYKTLKVPLNAILRRKHNKIIMEKINNSVGICNVIVTRIYEFMNLFILYQLENNREIPKFDKNLIVRITGLIGLKDTRGRKSKIIEDDLYIFNKTIFNGIYPELLKLNNLSYVIPILAEDIIKTLETNLKIHFPKYLRKLVNTTFISLYKEQLKNKEIPYSEEDTTYMYLYLDKEYINNPKYKQYKETLDKRISSKDITREYRKVLYKNLKIELEQVKNDLFTSKVEKSLSKYHDFINKYINLYPKLEVPKKGKEIKPLVYDVKVNPQKYIKLAIFINKDISINGFKCYQVIPQRTSLIPKHITLNTSGLTEVLNDKKKEIFDVGYSEIINNTKEYQDYLWSTILIHNFNKKYKSKNYKFYNQISTDGFSASLLFIRSDLYNKEYGDLIDKGEEVNLRYIDELSDKELNKLKDKNFIGNDPGNISIITATDGSKFYEYSNVRRRSETYTKRSREILKEEKVSKDIINQETIFSQECIKYNFNRRSLDFTSFRKFMETKIKTVNNILNFYKDIKWRKINFRIYSRTQHAENKMLNELVQKFGPEKDIVIGMGDHSVRAMRGTMPVPGRSIHKLLSRRFEHIYLIDEFRTSQLYNKDSSKKLINLKINKRSKHRLLTPKENPKGVIVNRDHNASENIRNILKEYILSRKRPEAFKRSLRKVDFCK